MSKYSLPTRRSMALFLTQTILSLFFIGLPTIGVWAQENTPLPADTSLQLNEVTIGSGKIENNKLKIPNHIQIIGAREINYINASTAANLLEAGGQVFVQKSQMGGGSPILRGFEASKVLIVLDNVRMNNAIFRGGHLQNVVRIDNAALDRAEVVFGAGSVVYGSDALGGVVHFRTKGVQLAENSHLSGQAYVRYATANQEKTAHLNLNYGRPHFGSLTSITVSDFGDLRQGKSANPFEKDAINIFNRNWYVETFNGKDSLVSNSNPALQKQSAYRQYNLLQKFKFVPASGNTTHELNFYFTNTNDVPRYDRLTEYSTGASGSITPKYAVWNYGPETWAMANYQFKHLASNALWDNLTVAVAGQYFAESRHSRRFNAARLKSQYEKVYMVSANIDALKNMGKHSLQYGLEATQNIVNSTAKFTFTDSDSTAVADTRYPDGGNAMGAYSVYAMDRFAISTKLNLNAGIRYNFTNLISHFDNKDFFPFPFDEAKQNSSALVGNIGLTYNPNQQTKIGANLSSGYRVPNVDDMSKVFESGGGILVIPNPNLSPEYAYNAELNLAKTWGNAVKIEANLYYTYLRNALTRGKTQIDGQDSILYDGTMTAVYTTINKDKAYIAGGYLGISTQIGKVGLSATANYTVGKIIVGEGQENTPLDHIPPLNGQCKINYQAKKWRADFWAAFNGWKRIANYRLDAEDNELYATPDGMPAWFTLNLRGEYRFSPQWVVQAGIDNILDTNYRTFASGISASGRNISATLHYYIK